MDDPIRVMVVDDHAMVRHSLEIFLAAFDDLIMVGEADDGEDAVRLCEEVMPNVVLMDLMMQGLDGLAATRAIHKNWPLIRVVILTQEMTEKRRLECLQAGAAACLSKSVPINDIAQAIRLAHKGKTSDK